VAHAKPEHLEGLEPLLLGIRKNSSLKEKSFGCFYFKGKGVLHFHIKGERLYAHVFDGKNWCEVDIKTPLQPAKQKRLSEAILQILPIT
jgi:hypothetical protein